MGRFLRQEPQAAPLRRSAGGTSEHEKLCRARDQCREILRFVNEAVKQTENRQRVEGYQKRLDTTSLERASNPLAAEFKVRGRERSARRHTPRPGPRRAGVLGAGDVGCVGQGALRALVPWPAFPDRCRWTVLPVRTSFSLSRDSRPGCRPQVKAQRFREGAGRGGGREGRGRPEEGGRDTQARAVGTSPAQDARLHGGLYLSVSLTRG